MSEIVRMCSGLALAIIVAGFANAQGARYRVTFDAVWSAETHPTGFPPNPHFSGLIGAVHGPEVEFWNDGEFASPGIQNMAETGGKTPLNSEVNAAVADGTAFALLSGGGINPSPGEVSLEFEATVEQSLVTLVSMIAPSPDWFVGVHSLDLRENDDWSATIEVPLFGYDAGTDSGSAFTSPNAETDPPERIFILTQPPFTQDSALVPLGTFLFEFLEETDGEPMNPPMGCAATSDKQARFWGDMMMVLAAIGVMTAAARRYAHAA